MTTPRSAATRYVAESLGVVVVCQFFATFNVPRRNNPNRVTYNIAVAVWPTGMVDKPRQIAADMCIAREKMIDSEAPNFSTLEVFILTKEAISIPYFLARIVNDSFIFFNILPCINAPPI